VSVYRSCVTSGRWLLTGCWRRRRCTGRQRCGASCQSTASTPRRRAAQSRTYHRCVRERMNNGGTGGVAWGGDVYRVLAMAMRDRLNGMYNSHMAVACRHKKASTASI